MNGTHCSTNQGNCNYCPPETVCVKTNDGMSHCRFASPCGILFPFGCPIGHLCTNTTAEKMCRIPIIKPGCKSNSSCVEPNSYCDASGKCVCNPGSGGSTCTESKSSYFSNLMSLVGCREDNGCPNNAYCVGDVEDGVIPYCHCKPGWTGLECDIRTHYNKNDY